LPTRRMWLNFQSRAGLDAEDAQIDRVGTGGNDAVFCDDAILLAAGYDFAGQQKEWLI